MIPPVNQNAHPSQPVSAWPSHAFTFHFSLFLAFRFSRFHFPFHFLFLVPLHFSTLHDSPSTVRCTLASLALSQRMAEPEDGRALGDDGKLLSRTSQLTRQAISKCKRLSVPDEIDYMDMYLTTLPQYHTSLAQVAMLSRFRMLMQVRS